MHEKCTDVKFLTCMYISPTIQYWEICMHFARRYEGRKLHRSPHSPDLSLEKFQPDVDTKRRANHFFQSFCK